METPKSLIEAIQKFSDPQFAHDYLVAMRWADGVECPHCTSREVTFMEKYNRWKCRGCRKQFGVKYNTIFENSPLSLGQWLTAMWLILNCKNGISSCEVARDLNVTQKTAWFMLHRIRKMMEVGSFEKLTGEVEMDETYVGGKAKNMHADRRQAMRAKGFPKACVFGMKERESGEVHTKVVTDTTRDTIQREICQNVEPGATVYTDSAKAYDGLSASYKHDQVDHNKGLYAKYDGDRMISTNGIENYWSVLDRCSYGTYIHQSDQHLPRYLAEEDFRYNSRKQKDGERFQTAMSGLNGKRLTYQELTTSYLQHMAPIE